jgi:hypothetical protein
MDFGSFLKYAKHYAFCNYAIPLVTAYIRGGTNEQVRNNDRGSVHEQIESFISSLTDDAKITEELITQIENGVDVSLNEYYSKFNMFT